MADTSSAVEIPKRALFKAAEVCDLVKVQPYVLRSWEAEFPNLGAAKTAGGPRTYRRADVEQALRIKHLLLVEGLTLAGARRKLEEAAATVAPNAPRHEPIGKNARDRLTAIKRGLRSILELLSAGGTGERLVSQTPTRSAPPPAKSIARGRGERARRKSSASRQRAVPRRKRPS